MERLLSHNFPRLNCITILPAYLQHKWNWLSGSQEIIFHVVPCCATSTNCNKHLPRILAILSQQFSSNHPADETETNGLNLHQKNSRELDTEQPQSMKTRFLKLATKVTHSVIQSHPRLNGIC
jgi:hypothetical protein